MIGYCVFSVDSQVYFNTIAIIAARNRAIHDILMVLAEINGKNIQSVKCNIIKYEGCPSKLWTCVIKRDCVSGIL